MARALAGLGHQNAFFIDPGELADAVPQVDVIVLVGRLDGTVLDVAAAAHGAGVPVILDLADDLLSRSHSANRDGRNGVNLAALAPVLAGITVPTHAFAARVKAEASALGLSAPPVHVVPDIAETRAVYDETARFMDTVRPKSATTGAAAPTGGTAPASAKPAGGLKRVVWFGEASAPHTTCGIFSLLPALEALGKLNKRIALELVVVSDDKAVFDELIKKMGFPTRFVPFSPPTLFDELERAHVALLTGGDDAFEAVQSQARALQAMAMGVPVVTTSNRGLVEFDGIALTGNVKMVKKIDQCLSMDRANVEREFIAPAAPILARYSPERLGALWEKILTGAAARAKEARAAAAERTGVLFFLHSPRDAGPMRTPVEQAVAAGLTPQIVVTAEALSKGLAVRKFLSGTKQLPRIVTGPDDLFAGTFDGVGTVVVRSLEETPARKVAQLGESAGATVVTADVAARLWTPASAAAAPATAVPPAPKQPGPYPERVNPDGSSDWAFIVNPKGRGWILEAICREIGSRQPSTWQMVFSMTDLPPARSYFFSHHSVFVKLREKFARQLSAANTFIWFTHPRSETPELIAKQLAEFSTATKVIFTCEMNRQLWLDRGLDPERCTVVLGGADKNLFRGHQRGSGVVGLSSSFYERKNPDLIREVVQLLPHRRFVLVGKGWENYGLFEELLIADNFTYTTASYAEYPAIYDTFDVFFSPSQLEGGPIPLVEAMMANAVPVASHTGFAPDLIKHGENGFLFDIDAPASVVAELIERAFAIETDVRESVLFCDWDAFSSRVVSLAP